MRRPSVTEGLIVLGVASALAVVMTYPLATGLDRLGRVDSGDGIFSIWNVAWVAHALTTQPSTLADANIFHPNTGTLFYAESNLGAGVLATPVYALTRSPFAAHNVVLLLSFVLSAVGMYGLARHVSGSRAGAAVAAVLFAYCPYAYAHNAHIQLLMTATLPFSMLSFHRLVERPSPGRAVELGLVLTATALLCGYYSVFVAMLVGGGSLYYLATRRYWRNGAYYAAIAASAALVLVLTYPLLSHYLGLGQASKPFRSLAESREYSANIASYLAAAGFGNSWLHRFSQGFTEVLFPGFVTLALAAVGSWVSVRLALAARRPDPDAAPRPVALDTVAFYAAAGGIACWLSFGPDAGLYTIGYRYVPLFTLMRAPARFGLVLQLALCVFAAIGAAAITAGRRRAWLAGVLVVLGAVELAAIPFPVRRVEPPSAANRALATLPPGVVAEFPFFYREGDFHRHTYYMLGSMAHWKPLVNGYSDFYPRDFLEIALPVSSFPTLESFKILQARRVRYVVIHPEFYDRRSLEKVEDRLQQYQEFLRPIVSDADARLYEVVAWPSAEPVR